MKVLIDAETILGFLAGDEKIGKIILKFDETAVSVFDYSFLIAGAENSLNISHNLYLIKEFISENFEMLEYTRKEANVFARLKRKYKDADGFVLLNASIALTHKLTLITVGDKYDIIKELKIIKV